MAVNLTAGAIAALSSTDGTPSAISPIVQVSDLRLVNTQNQTNERYRLLLSDGVHFQQGMLATQKNELVRSKALQKGSIVELTSCICNTIQGRKIIIILDLNVILDKCDLIGEPKQFDKPENTASSVPVARPSAQVQSTMEQPSAPSSYQPSHAGNSLGGAVAKPNVHVGSIPSQPNIDRRNSPSYVGFPASNSNSGGYGATKPPAMYSKPEFGAGNPHAPSNSYGRPSSAPYQQQHPMNYVNKGSVFKNEAPPRIIPIVALNPYQGRWTIKARVTAKGELRPFKNTRGEGKVFSFDLLDSGGGEIRVTCFNNVADQYYGVIDVGRVYLISKGSLKPAQKAYNHLNNEFEITLDTSSTVEPCLEDDTSIPNQQYHFRPISDIENMNPNTIVDVIGVVSSVSPATVIAKKDGTETVKRALQLRDNSGRSVELTLWGNFCNAEGQKIQEMCDSGVFPVLAVKSGRISDFNGKAVGTLSSSQLIIEPDFEETARLKEWFQNEGINTRPVSISRESAGGGKADVRKTISQIKDENLGMSEKPDWITVSATIFHLKLENFCYTACPLMIGDRQCNKKVTDNGDQTWRCDRCDKNIPECDYRYILQFQIQDHTGLTWVTGFQECGEEIMGVSAKDLYHLKYEDQDDERFADIVRSVLFSKYLFKLKVKEEMYNDESRVKSTVVKAEKLNYVSESRFLLNSLGKDIVGNVGSLAPSAYVNTGVSSTPSGTIGARQPTPAVPSYTGLTGNPMAGRGQQPSQVGSQNVNQYSSSRFPASGSAGSAMTCNSCGGSGHSSSNCPSYMNVQGQSYGGGFPSRAPSAGGGGSGGAGGGGECFKCHQTGHWARDCPGGLSNIAPAYGNSSGAPGRTGGYSNQRVGGY